MINTPWILIQKRLEGVQAGNSRGGGWLYGGMRTIARLKEPPEEPWYDHLLNNYGEGRYLVTTQNPVNGQLMTLFPYTFVRYEDDEVIES